MAALTDECAAFLLELMGIKLSEVDALWFFSDWSQVVLPRSFEERLHDLAVSHGLRPSYEFW